MSPGFKLWTPRLRAFADDVALWSKHPVKRIFEERLGMGAASTRRGGDLLWVELRKELEKDAEWVEIASDWLAFTLGGEIVSEIPEEALSKSWNIMFDVLFLRYSANGAPESDVIARNMLLREQMANFRAYNDVGADYSMFDDLDRRDNWEGDSAGDRDSDWEDVDDPMDEDYEDEEYEDNSEDDPMEDHGGDSDEEFFVDFVQSHPPPSPAAIPSHRPPPDLAPADLPAHWLRHINVFFYPVVKPLHLVQKGCRSKGDVVDDLRDMRNLPKRTYQSPAFQVALEETGLLERLHKICRLGNLLETSHPDVEASFRFHNWKMSYGYLICQWTPRSISEEEYEKVGANYSIQTLMRRPKPDPHYKFSPKEAMDLLSFMSSHHRMHPWAHNPMAAYLFLSLDCFTFNAETWLVPCLETLKYPRVAGWNSVTIFRTIKELPLLKDISAPDSLEFLEALEDRKLAVVLEETSLHRALMRRVKTYTWRPPPGSDNATSSLSSSRATGSRGPHPKPKPPKLSKGEKRNQGRRAKKEEKHKAGGEVEEETVQMDWLDTEPLKEQEELLTNCPMCRDEKMEDRCVRLFPVTPRKDVKRLRGVVLTCAAPEDRLRPLPPPKRRKGGKTPRPRRRIRYLDPVKLGMTWIKPQPHVQERCGRDITRFVFTPKNGLPEFVGGVRYNAFEPLILERLIDNHRRVKIRGVRRRDEMQAWAYGSMTPSGNRQPAGGLQGDGYGPYACHKGDTPDDIRALFRHAVDADVIIEVGRLGLSPAQLERHAWAISDILQKRPKKELRGTTFPCAQLAQSGTDKTRHEWDFAMGKWSVVIETQANTVWAFNGQEEHATVHPSQSSYNAGAQSSGYHPTKRQRDAARAQAIQQIRLEMGLRPRN
ncbi:hypothetical protein B0H11DRAFT_1926162 [Mycena galericulata]|nr:hypothetical protein B0H11DRAFT_1926162 [Mycena galericulata]